MNLVSKRRSRFDRRGGSGHQLTGLLGSPESIESATALVNELAAELPPPPAEILSIELPPSVDPGALTKLLRDALLQLDVAGGTSRPRRSGSFPTPKAIRWCVTGSESDLELVTQLLAAIAKPAGDVPREAEFSIGKCGR